MQFARPPAQTLCLRHKFGGSEVRAKKGENQEGILTQYQCNCIVLVFKYYDVFDDDTVCMR